MGSDAVPRNQYLWKTGGRYYVRGRVPTHLVPFIGKAELTRSLHTSVYDEARKRADLEIAQMRLAFDKAEAALALAEDTSSNKLERLSFSEIDTLVRNWFDRSKRDLLENWSFRATGFNEAGEDMEAMREETLAGIEDRLRREAISEGRSDPSTTQPVADELLIREGFAARPRKSGRTGRIALVTSPRAEVDEQSAKYRHLIACFRDAHLELLRFHRSILVGSILVGSDLDQHQVSPLPETGLTLDELIDAFLDDPRKQGISEKRRIDYNMIFRILREVLGGEKKARDITREDFRKISKIIREIPKNCTKLFPEISFSEAARRAEVEGLQRLNSKTITTHLEKVGTLFRWAENEDYVARNLARSLSDPGAGMHRKGDRYPFSDNDLQKIFSERYVVWSDAFSHERNNTRFFVPLISLFHEMRLNEICQINLQQVRQENAIWYFDIRTRVTANA